MKCIYCDKKAEYIMSGTTICGEHTECISNWGIPSFGTFIKSPLYKKHKTKDDGR